MIPIFEPYLIGNEKKYANRCLKSNWISSQGGYVIKFEKSIAKYHNMKYCIATSSCTTAIHLAIKSLGIGKGDEIICPSLTFISPANMIRLSGAKLVLVDINIQTLTIDPEKIRSKISKNTKAIIVVHQFGHAAHMDEIKKIANEFNLMIIEDNAESIGGKYKNKLLGTIGHISTFSFFSNKIITTGEGGAILTNNKKIAEKARILRDHGMSERKKYHHIYLGYNYRMTNMQAAIGLAQVEKLNEILKIRNKQMELYYNNLKNIKEIELRKFAKWCYPVHWLMTLSIKNKSNKKIIKFMKKHGVDCRPMINPVFKANHFKKYFSMNDSLIADKISKNYFHLPSSTLIKINEINFICNLVKKFIKNN